jgi:hypothetical protein
VFTVELAAFYKGYCEAKHNYCEGTQSKQSLRKSLRKTEVDKSVRIPMAGAKHVSLSGILPVLSRMS